MSPARDAGSKWSLDAAETIENHRKHQRAHDETAGQDNIAEGRIHESAPLSGKLVRRPQDRQENLTVSSERSSGSVGFFDEQKGQLGPTKRPEPFGGIPLRSKKEAAGYGEVPGSAGGYERDPDPLSS